MNVFTCGEKISKLAVSDSRKFHSSQSSANLSINQSFFKNCYYRQARYQILFFVFAITADFAPNNILSF